MKVAIAASGPSLRDPLDPRFGRAKWFAVFDTATGEHDFHSNETNLNATQGAGIQTAQRLADLGVEAVVAGNIGPKAFQTLRAAGIRPLLASGCSVKEALERFQAGELHSNNDAPTEQDVLMQFLAAGARLNSILAKVDRGEGTLGLLLNDPTLYEEVKQLVGGANRRTVVRSLIQMITPAEE